MRMLCWGTCLVLAVAWMCIPGADINGAAAFFAASFVILAQPERREP